MVAAALSIGLVALVAVGNVLLGFFLACRLGRGPLRWTESDYRAARSAWEAARLGAIAQLVESPAEAGAEPTANPRLLHEGQSNDPWLAGLIRKLKSVARDWGRLARSLEGPAAIGSDFESASAAPRLTELASQVERLVAEALNRLATRDPASPQRQGIERALVAVRDSASMCQSFAMTLASAAPAPVEALESAWSVVESLHGARDACDDALSHWEARDLPRHGLLGRAAVETAAVRLREQVLQRNERLGCALLDVDLMTLVNRKQGIEVAERLLAALADTVRSQVYEPNVAAWWSGQQIVMLFPGQSAAEMSAEFERLRQTIEKTQFTFDGSALRVTVSGGVAESLNSETWTATVERLRAALHEAKTYGRNRLFVFGESGASSVTPLELDLPQRTVPL